MATVIDALVVELGLDPKGFTKGQKEAAAALVKTRKSAEKEAKEIERSLDRASEGFDRLIRNALKLFAVFTTGRAIKDFISDITASDAALGRLAKSLETTPQALSALGGAVSRSGGSADAAANSFQRLANSYNELKLTGRSATYDMLSRISGATGKVIRYGKDTQRTLYDIADAAKAMSEQSGVSFTTNILEQAGLDPGTISLLIQGSEKMREAQEKVKRLGGVVSKQDTENAQRFSTALHDVGTISEGLGRTIWTNLSPAISEIIEKVIKWYEANGEWLRSEIAEKVKMLADYLRSIDWEAIGTGIKEFASGANEAAKAVGGWKVVFEALLGAWLFTKLLALLRVLGLIRLAITGSATPGIFGSLVGALGIGGTAAVGAAVGTAVGADAAVPNAAKPGVTNHWDDEASGAAGGAGMGGVFRRGGRWLKRKLGFGGGGAGSGSGSGEGSRSFRNNNPGNIKYGPFAQRMGATGADSAGFARFPDYAAGRKAQESLLFNSDSYKDLTIGQAIARWAPGSDGNDPAGYAAQMAKAAGVGVDTKMSDLTPEQRGRFLDAQQRKEGWIPGGGGGRQVAGSIQPNNGAGGVDQQQGGATHRKQPITDVLAKQISDAAASAGVNAEVFSGGQSESGADHYGSHRHDHGRSADLRLYNVGQDGKRRYLNMTNDADRVVMEKFIRESVKNGANGVGASPTYMGPLGIHVGGGSPAAWGAGGSSVNAPEWVRRAHQQGMGDRLVAAAQAAKAAKPAAPAPKPEAAFDAARRAGAMASVASANAASATVASRVSNDNRNTDNRRYDETHLHNVSVYPATGTQSSIMAELKQAARGGKAFAAEADYGKA
ncbi:hypothetical protein R1A27_34405 (plasmid) [Methylobacterium sp. NMS12]|uniref:hypothetical protein n=1 Tax=Methylobacterium sp. NMS12 TaxID=3079766 RepID=UPI003F88098C